LVLHDLRDYKTRRFFSVLIIFMTVLTLFNCGSTTNGTAVKEEAAPVIKEREILVLFPFTGISSEDGEAIVTLLTQQSALRDTFESVSPLASNFDRRSEPVGPDTIFELGKEQYADYVISGYITSLGNQKFVIVNIMDVESLQLVAGYYKAYNTIEEIAGFMPEIAQKFAAAVTRDTSNLPAIAVPPFSISQDVNQNDAQVLAQILALELANSGRYVVLPQTDILVQERSRPQYALSGSVRRLGNLNRIGADILNIEDGKIIVSGAELYSTLSDGISLMPPLAASLNVDDPVPENVVRVDIPVPVNFVRVEGGTFVMGQEGVATPVHTVTVKSFFMARNEVTQKEYQEIMGNNPSNTKSDNYPVEMVSWYDAIEYCNRRSLREGLTPVYRGTGDNIVCDWDADGYRLPTEAEWEYAAKGGNKDPIVFEYSGSNNIEAVAWYGANSNRIIKPVGIKAPNSLGLYDMSGNAWEWCWDWFGSYSSAAQTDPRGASSGTARVYRGGSASSPIEYVRSAYRGSNVPSSRFYSMGFRLVRN